MKDIFSLFKIRFADCDPVGHLNNVKYLEYMLNAREDHIAERYGFTYEEYVKKTGCTWITVENKIAYLKETRYNQIVKITSRTIALDSRTTTVEVLMTYPDSEIVYAVLWVKAIYFNMKTRKSDKYPKETMELLSRFLVKIPFQNFEERSTYLRHKNKEHSNA